MTRTLSMIIIASYRPWFESHQGKIFFYDSLKKDSIRGGIRTSAYKSQ